MSLLGPGGCDRGVTGPTHKGRGKTDLTRRRIKHSIKGSIYKSYNELPLFLKTETVAKVPGVSPPSRYELMHEADFPVLKIGNKCVILKEKFVEWVSRHTQGGAE